jgi:hypothetical protein
LKVYDEIPVLVILRLDDKLVDLVTEGLLLEVLVLIVFVTDGVLERVVVSVLIGEYVIRDGLVLGEPLPE